jgi:tryptophanyl-tRNA synthetase
MSLTDPTQKMSKSDPDPMSRILITDSKHDIQLKIKGARTDSLPGISYNRKLRPGVSNLIDIIYYMNPDTSTSPELIAEDMSDANMSMKALKEKVADTVDEGLHNIREKYHDIAMLPTANLHSLCLDGLAEAKRVAGESMDKVKQKVGLIITPNDKSNEL